MHLTPTAAKEHVMTITTSAGTQHPTQGIAVATGVAITANHSEGIAVATGVAAGKLAANHAEGVVCG